MALFTVRAAAEQLGVAYSTFKSGYTPDGCGRRGPKAGIIACLRTKSVGCSRAKRPRPRRRLTSDADEALGGLSARNRLHGFIEEVRVDGLLAQVRLRVGDQSLTAVITADAVRALKLRRGDDAMAIVKSTEVMIARAGHQESRPKRRS